MNYILSICLIISFLVVLYITPWSIRYLRRIKLIVKDQNKKDKPLVPLSGGMSVLSGFFMGIMIFIFLNTFFPNGEKLILSEKVLMLLLSSLISIIMITLVGFVDDILIRDDNESSTGLKQWQKPLLTLVAAVPLMVVNSGIREIAFPILGVIDTGLLYPLIIIPIGVIGAANMVNLLAGLNGLETGIGIISIGMLALYSYFHIEDAYQAERTAALIISSLIFASLLAFYFFNKYPAKILPGDSLTYLIGGALASIAIIGNLERVTIIVSIPFFIEFFLKLRGKFNKHSYGFYENGKVKSFYKKAYSIPHLFTMTGKFTEKQVVYIILGIELFFSSLIWVI